ncbi:hypothetical protein [Cohnella sp.]|uniref:hypothetical protein n=1 Tax=Cohnella sp. TaxID=1883426 RepID=UPI003567859B
MEKTKRIVKTLLAGMVVSSMTGCGTQAAAPTVPMPTDPGCNEWEWEADDGVWECDDKRSSYYGGFFFAGMYYMTKSKLRSNPAYKNYYSGYKGGGFGSGNKGASGG